MKEREKSWDSRNKQETVRWQLKSKYISNDKNINMGNAAVIVRFNLQNKQPSVVYKKRI